MTHRQLGTTGVRVSPLTLGALNFGKKTPQQYEDSKAVLHAALDAGINIIDTSDSYHAGESEEVVGEVLRERGRDDIVVATKFNRPNGDDPNRRGNSRRWIFHAVDASLKRLGTDWIDLYQAHRPDPDTDIAETVDALTDLVRAGKIRYFGTSTFQAHELVEAQWAAADRRLNRPVTEQPPYSILVRGIERAVLPVAREHRIAVLPWSPLAAGWLSGKYPDAGGPEWSRRLARQPHRADPSNAANQDKAAAVRELTRLADEAGLSLIHLSIAFVLQHPAITSAIIGPRTVDHLKSALDAPQAVLTTDVLDRIDAIVPPGTTVNPTDDGHVPPSLTDPALRRRAVPSSG
ncbi:Predicted oxidoreductase [Actinacidiphila alni]|uniref:Predicted oxidoreductase n=1 Tax=Actinacidiphila alni TaxID=380248 RepID=A0A1I2ID56_9ACTN|nr:aldo/keto reductase [Actinacidiphila alni]SFF39560.1 Predicted oxidoreductase [Actinacidiphila alni]